MPARPLDWALNRGRPDDESFSDFRPFSPLIVLFPQIALLEGWHC